MQPSRYFPLSLVYLALTALGLGSCSGNRPLSPKAMQAYLQGLKQPGFQYQRSPSADAWLVAFQGPGMKQAWSVAVAITGAAAANNQTRGAAAEGRFVSVGTTVWQGSREPGPAFQRLLLELNALDNNVGALSLFQNGGGYYVQVFTKSPLAHYGSGRLLFEIGFIAGFADAVRPRLAAAAL